MQTVEYLLLQECKESKKTRENIIKAIERDHNDILHLVVKIYNLKRVKDKYILSFRNYDENSYSKNKIKYEELVLIRKAYLFLKISDALDDQIRFKKMSDQITGGIIDDNLYKQQDLELYKYLFENFYKKVN